MKRTQIYFPEELHEDLLIGAKMSNLTLSAYIRKILNERAYFRITKRKSVPRKKAGLSLLAENAIDLGIRDAAKNFDKYFEESLK